MQGGRHCGPGVARNEGRTDNRRKIVPDPPLLMVTDRRQARRPLPDVVAAALKAGCRWVSVREKDLPRGRASAAGALADLPLARAEGREADCCTARRRWPARRRRRRASAVRQRPGGRARAHRAGKRLIGVSIHTVTEAEAIDPALCRLCAGGSGLRDREQAGLRPRDRPQGSCRHRARGAGAGAGHRRHQRGARRRIRRRGRGRRRA